MDVFRAQGRIRRMTKLWQLLLTAVYFTAFAVFGYLMALIWFNTLALFVHGRERTLTARRSISASFRFFWNAASFLHFMDRRVEGLEKLKEDRGVMVIANHPSLVDYVLLASLMPTCDCVVKASLKDKISMRHVIKSADYLMNSDGPELIEECRERFRLGDNILIFPEGTRTPADGTLKFRHGFARIALRCRCPIRLVTLQCSEHLLDKSRRWYNVPDKKPVFTVKVLDLICADEIDTFARNCSTEAIAARHLCEHLQERFRQALEGK